MELKSIPVDTRKAVFRAVVEAEDRGERPSEARQLAATQFQLTVDQVRAIEDEGVEKTWPPLQDCD